MLSKFSVCRIDVYTENSVRPEKKFPGNCLKITCADLDK